MTDNEKNDLAAGIIVFGFLALLIALVCWGVFSFSSWKCNQQWKDAYPSRFHFGTGCQVQIHDKWMPANSVRDF